MHPRRLADEIMQLPPSLRKAELNKAIGRNPTTEPARLQFNAKLITAIRIRAGLANTKPPWQN